MVGNSEMEEMISKLNEIKESLPKITKEDSNMPPKERLVVDLLGLHNLFSK